MFTKIFLFAFILIGATVSVNAQSMFKPLPKPASAFALRDGITIVDTPAAGANFIGLRFTGPTVLYAVSPGNVSTSTLYTMIGVDYESDAWDATKGKFYTNWAIGLQAGEGGTMAPGSLSAVTAIGLTFSFQKIGSFESPIKITFGALYNFQNKVLQPAVGPGVALVN